MGKKRRLPDIKGLFWKNGEKKQDVSDIKIEKKPWNAVENGKKLFENLENIPFKVWQMVLIPRTNWDPSYGKITSYEEKSKKYRVEWINSEWKQCSKTISGEVLKEINDRYTIDWNYFVGKRVLIPRTNWDPTLGRIERKELDGGITLYVVFRKDPDKSVNGDNSYFKRLTKEKLDELNAPAEIVLEWWEFVVWQMVLIPRTNWDPSYAKITSYNKEENTYIVERINSKWEKLMKKIKEETLKEINDKYTIDWNYFVGKRVLIPRTNWDPTLATIISVPEWNEDEYTVLRKDADKIGRGGERTHTKRLTKADLDKLNVLSEEVEVVW